MAGARTELGQMLERGIAAAKAGDRKMARELLTRVVERDERNVTAWLWLSGVVDGADDRQVCLENVLTLDPGNQAARRGLELLHKETEAPSHPHVLPSTGPLPSLDRPAPTLASAILHGTPDKSTETKPPAEDSSYTPPSIEEGYRSSKRASPTLAAALLRKAPEPAGPEPEEEAPSAYAPPALPRANYPAVPRWSELQDAQATLGEFDDENLCPYCAEPTQPEDNKCAECGGQLWRSAPRLRERSWLLWLMVAFLVIAVIWQLYIFMALRSSSIQPFFTDGKITLDQFVWLYMGQHPVPLDVEASLFSALPLTYLWSFVIIIGLQLGLAVLVYFRWRPFYWFAIGVAALNAALAVAQGLITPQTAVGWAIILAIALVPLGLLLSIQQDFMAQRERILCALDKDIKSHSALYTRGREYAMRKMWTLAAVHFQRAVAEAPTMIAYHLALANAYARLKRYERAQSVLQEAEQIAPDNQEVRALSEQLAKERADYVGI